MKRSVHSCVLAFVTTDAFLALLPRAAAADICGMIKFNGTSPPEVNITPLKEDVTCGALHKEMPTTHFYKVGAHREFGDVVVSLAGVHGQTTGPNCTVREYTEQHYLPAAAAYHLRGAKKGAMTRQKAQYGLKTVACEKPASFGLRSSP